MSRPTPATALPDSRPEWLPHWAWAQLRQDEVDIPADHGNAVNLPAELPEERPAWLPEKIWAVLRRDRVDYGSTVVL